MLNKCDPLQFTLAAKINGHWWNKEAERVYIHGIYRIGLNMVVDDELRQEEYVFAVNTAWITKCTCFPFYVNNLSKLSMQNGLFIEPLNCAGERHFRIYTRFGLITDFTIWLWIYPVDIIHKTAKRYGWEFFDLFLVGNRAICMQLNTHTSWLNHNRRAHMFVIHPGGRIRLLYKAHAHSLKAETHVR